MRTLFDVRPSSKETADIFFSAYVLIKYLRKNHLCIRCLSEECGGLVRAEERSGPDHGGAMGQRKFDLRVL